MLGASKLTWKMTMLCEQTAPISGAIYYSIAQHAPFGLFLYRKHYAADLVSPPDMPPKNLCSNAPPYRIVESSPIDCDNSPQCDLLSHRLPPGECSYTVQSISKLYLSFSSRMTILRPVLGWQILHPLGLAQLTSQLALATARLFFNPSGNGVTRHPKGAPQPPQAASLLIRPQNLLPPLIRVAIAAWIITAVSATTITVIFLFTIGSMTIANQLLALTVRTLKSNCDHFRLLYIGR
jgi:hypothetical protein